MTRFWCVAAGGHLRADLFGPGFVVDDGGGLGVERAGR